VLTLLVVAAGPVLATRHAILQSSFALTDLAALAAMLGFAACLAAMVWSASVGDLSCESSAK
jgi:hypothetical protein